MKRQRNQSGLWRPPGIILLGLLSSFSVPARATAELVLQLETSLTSDTNPFRFYDGQKDAQQNTIERQSDKQTGTELRAGAILPIASDRTRLILTGSLGNHHYKNYRDLDHHLSAGDASLEWAAGNAVSGRVTAGKEDRLFQYINGTLTDRDLSHQTRAGADLNLKINNDWTVTASLDKSGLGYDLQVNKLYNFDERGKQLGIRYMSPTGSSVAVGTRLSETVYPDRNAQQIADLDQRYKETEVYLDGEWRYSVKSVTSAHLGLIRRRYDSLVDNDTRLFNTLWRGTYHYSPKLRLDIQIWDRPFNIIDPTILYVVTKGARFDALWKWSDKTQFNFSTLLQNSDQTLVPRLAALEDGISRKETLQRFGVGANYQFQRGFRLFLDSFYEKVKRESDQANLNQAVVKLGFEYTYENLPGSAARVGLTRYQHSLSASDALR
ncbi:MAG: hypothetical protein KGM99_11970 [Burkholderiales bacterium]|nr:hypothetical protein [Burkholderiales bacterium]